MEAIKKHCINLVDSRETGMEKPDTLTDVYEEPADVMIFDGFIEKSEEDLRRLYDSLGLAMTFRTSCTFRIISAGKRTRPIRDGDPRAGHLLVRSLPSHHIFHGTEKCYLCGRILPGAY